LKGTEWAVVSDFLGKPHFTLKNGGEEFIYSKDEILYRYVCYTFGDYKNFKDVGNTILDIIVVEGTIKDISVFDNDG